jgi:hypothetical protein
MNHEISDNFSNVLIFHGIYLCIKKNYSNYSLCLGDKYAGIWLKTSMTNFIETDFELKFVDV